VKPACHAMQKSCLCAPSRALQEAPPLTTCSHNQRTDPGCRLR
jgi:hypothetical protein